MNPGPMLAFRAIRLPVLGVTLLGCLIGLATFARDGGEPQLVLALITIVLALLAHAAGNLYNDFGDSIVGSDAINTTRIAPFTGGSRLIQLGIITASRIRMAAVVLAGVAISGGLFLTYIRGPGLLAIGIAGAALGWAYSHPGVALMARGLGELAVAASWWLVVVGADFVQRGTFATTPMLAGVSFALLVAAILLVNEFPDRAADAAAGKRTLVVRLGPARAATLLMLLVVGAHGWIACTAWSGALPVPASAAAASLPLAVAATSQVVRAAGSSTALRRAIKLTLGTAALHAVLLIAGLLVGASAPAR